MLDESLATNALAYFTAARQFSRNGSAAATAHAGGRSSKSSGVAAVLGSARPKCR
jgi:hypothetical protein